MLALLMTTMMSLPVFPLNPIKQDTVSYMNLHVTAGVEGPGSMISVGPEITAKYEFVIEHPFILRAAFDYRYGSSNSVMYPDGDIHRSMISLEALYYRGTDKYTGYIGGGVVLSMYRFKLDQKDADSLWAEFGYTDVDISNRAGMRITAGLRIRKALSIEIGVTHTRPHFMYIREVGGSTTFVRQPLVFNDFRVSLGYLFTLKL